jgi:hypothetical protein
LITVEIAIKIIFEIAILIIIEIEIEIVIITEIEIVIVIPIEIAIIVIAIEIAIIVIAIEITNMDAERPFFPRIGRVVLSCRLPTMDSAEPACACVLSPIIYALD